MEKLKAQWSRIGFRFLEKPSAGSVDLEKLLVDTSKSGREDPVLLSAMLTWIIEFSDLINTTRLFRLLKEADGAVLGFILDLALSNHAHRKLKPLVSKCAPRTTPEVLFPLMAQMVTTREAEIENTGPLARKWGMFVSSIPIKADAMHNREWVLKHNPNLYFRALFGANIKAEVFSQLFSLKETYIKELSRTIGVSYQPVYAEVQEMVENHFLNIKSIGKTKLISINPIFGNHFLALLKAS